MFFEVYLKFCLKSHFSNFSYLQIINIVASDKAIILAIVSFW